MVKFCTNVQNWWLEELAECQFFLHSYIVTFNKERLIIEFLKENSDARASWIIIYRGNVWPAGIRESVIFAIFDYSIFLVSFLQRIHLSHSQKFSNLVSQVWQVSYNKRFKIPSGRSVTFRKIYRFLFWSYMWFKYYTSQVRFGYKSLRSIDLFQWQKISLVC